MANTIAAAWNTPILQAEMNEMGWNSGPRGQGLRLDFLSHLRIYGKSDEVKQAARAAYRHVLYSDPLILQAYNNLWSSDEVAEMDAETAKSKLPERFMERILSKRTNDPGALKSEHVISAYRVFSDENFLSSRQHAARNQQRQDLRQFLRKHKALLKKTKVLTVTYRNSNDPTGPHQQMFFWYERRAPEMHGLITELATLSKVPSLFAVEPRELAPDTLSEAQRLPKHGR